MAASMLTMMIAAPLVMVTIVNAARPPVDERTFVSDHVDAAIADIGSKMSDPMLASMFEQCLPNTLDTTVASFEVTQSGIPSTFIVTGDIHAMWLRDSTNQVLPYLRFARSDAHLRQMLCGLLQRQAHCVLKDAFANAFNAEDNGKGHQDDSRKPKMTAGVFEGKYELDSLAAVLKLGNEYFRATDDATCFSMNNYRWVSAAQRIIDTIVDQQASTHAKDADETYLFERLTTVASDTLALQARGAPARRCGLIKSSFRPSDDATILPFLIPANAMIVVELRALAETILKVLPSATSMAAKANTVALQIDTAIHDFAIFSAAATTIGGGTAKKALAYEVDGYGNMLFMDDANVPSLLSLPYLGYIRKTDELYLSTRELVLSSRNPYFFKGSAAEGVGGPHIGMNQIWPMSIIMRALTSTSDEEISECLEVLKSSTAGTLFMHESFDMDDPTKFTRSWFAWANSLFGELILTLSEQRPHLIFSTSDQQTEAKIE